MNQSNKSLLFGSRESLSFLSKTILVGVLCLGLMIPLMMIDSLVETRKSESHKVQMEITERWGQSQIITTPILAIPYTPDTKDAKQTHIYLLPRILDVDAQLNLEERHRNIYKVPVYTAHSVMKGAWETDDIRQAMKEHTGEYDLSKAKISLAISDAMGYKDLVYIQVKGEQRRMKSDNTTFLPIEVEEDSYVDFAATQEKGDFLRAGAQSTPYPIVLGEGNEVIDFECTLEIAGSRKFGFLAAAGSATLKSRGNWSAPSFQGRYLPTSYDITQEGYQAEWSTFYEDYFVPATQFGSVAINDSYINFIDPSDHYTQTDRSIKYGILVIVLSMLSIFLVELSMQRKGESISFLNYALSGLSLVLFYSLLLSFSEIIGFGWAYLIAGVMTIMLNFLYFRSIFKYKRYALLLALIMALLYIGVYILMQMKAFALLAGSLGLFAILAGVMFYSAKITKE